MNDGVLSWASCVPVARFGCRLREKKLARGAVVWLSFVGVVAPVMPARGVTEIIAISGEPAPDGNGTFSNFGVPAFSAGQIAGAPFIK